MPLRQWSQIQTLLWRKLNEFAANSPIFPYHQANSRKKERAAWGRQDWGAFVSTRIDNTKYNFYMPKLAAVIMFSLGGASYRGDAIRYYGMPPHFDLT